jgi:hypothetical protein
MNAPTPAFSLIKTEKIDSLNIEYQEYQHSHTEARHIHLAAKNSENVFMVALRTVPTDSSGVAHILEHTCLCGSERYPVRDPFFMMIRRSLNTFMNAFTSSDWTAYPFASQNKKDFNNLLAVYLDAVFFARLDPLDFAQEGHRLEFKEASNPESELLYKGVVFNEMKGAMSSVPSQLWQTVSEALFPDTTYHYNSGGDPAAIPDLSYEQLQAFYKTHYHPDNAVFITFGDIPASEHQAQIESLALQRFTPINQRIEVPHQSRFDAPRQHRADYTAEDDGKSNKTHRVMAWMLGDIKDPLELMSAHLLNSILLENSASPLQQVLETTELGSAPSPLCGLDDSSLQMVFVSGLEGCTENTAADFEKLLLDTLEKVAQEGVAYEKLVALLDQLELQQREISGDSYPYGLQLMLSCLPSAMHRGDPAAALDIDPVLKNLRNAIRDPAYVTTLINRLLINNPHRVTVELSPDTSLAQQQVDDEAKKLASIKDALETPVQQHIVDTAQALLERQSQQDDPDLLPKVGLDDVPDDIPQPPSVSSHVADHRFSFYPQGTNGLTYRQIISPLPALSESEIALLSLHNRILPEVGVAKQDYLQTQDWQTRVCGDLNSYSTIRGAIDNEQSISGYFVLSSKGLSARSNEIDELLHASYLQPRFDETQRIVELISQFTARAEQSVTGNGHSLAMSIACQGMNPSSALSHSTGGVLGIQNLKALNASLSETQAQQKLLDQLLSIQQKITSTPTQLLAIDDEAQQSVITENLSTLWTANKESTPSTLTLQPMRKQVRELWVCNSQVNFCAKAYPTVPAAHPDAPALTVLAGVLRNGYLHTAIREQGGAYGGGASQDSGSASFRFYSYRDPRLGETLEDFDRSVAWLLEGAHPWRVVEESILGVISSIDKPSSPAGTAKQHFHNTLLGRSHEHQVWFRNAVLDVTLEKLKQVAETYLKPDQASIGIISHAAEESRYKALASELSIAIKRL